VIIAKIPDGVLGREVLQFILSGHQLYTTLHVDCAHRILFRLPTMGVPVAELAEPGLIRLLIKQTLGPLLCKRLIRDGQLSAKDQTIVAPLNDDGDAVRKHGDLSQRMSAVQKADLKWGDAK